MAKLMKASALNGDISEKHTGNRVREKTSFSWWGKHIFCAKEAKLSPERWISTAVGKKNASSNQAWSNQLQLLVGTQLHSVQCEEIQLRYSNMAIQLCARISTYPSGCTSIVTCLRGDCVTSSFQHSGQKEHWGADINGIERREGTGTWSGALERSL